MPACYEQQRRQCQLVCRKRERSEAEERNSQLFGSAEKAFFGRHLCGHAQSLQLRSC